MADNQERFSSKKIAKARSVAPTILIGLGGTGKEVLLRLRRRLYERYGILGFPTMGYLWIDTDTRNRNIDNQPLDHVMEQVMLKEEERVSAEVPGDAFMGYFQDHAAFPHIFSWLDPRLSSLGQVLNGAGQVRPLGRLAFFHCYPDIRRKVDRILANIRQQSAVEEMLSEYGVEVDPNLLDVTIICSLAGGTGSGMFLDTAFMCRQNLPNPDITGYLLLPSVFADAINGNEKIYANAYAALKELEYYSLRKDKLRLNNNGDSGMAAFGDKSRHDFRVAWDKRGRDFGGDTVAIPPPAFNTCYLVDNVTQGGGVIGPKDKAYLCDMLAENIFLNFSSDEFARMKDSNRSNLEQFLGNPLIYKYEEGGYTEIFSQRFSTLGFSKLYIPVDRIRRACGYQLSLDLIDRWLKRNELNEIEIERRLNEREMVKLGLRAGAGGDDFYRELNRVGERSFDDEIRDWVNQHRTNLLQEASTGKPPKLYSTIQRLLAEFNKRNFDKVDARPENWGAYIKTLELNRDRFIKLTCGEFNVSNERVTDGSILTQVKDWLKDDRVRLDLAAEYLKVLGKVLTRHAEELYAKAKATHERKARTSYADLMSKLEMVRDEEGGWMVQRKALRSLVEHICDRMREHFSARMNTYIFSVAMEVINNNLKPYIGREEIKKDAQGNDVPERAGLVLELWMLKEQLGELRLELDSRFKSYDQVQEHLIYENLYEKESFRKHYQITEANEVTAPVSSKLDELESLLFQNVGVVNPYDFLRRIEDLGPERVRERIEEFCYSKFYKLEVKADAMEAFVKKYTKREERRKRLERFVTNGSVRLRKSSAAAILDKIMANVYNETLITVSSKNQEKFADEYSDINSLVLANTSHDPSHPTSARSDAVFLYTELAGIPLAYIGNIELYRDLAYIPLISEEKPLHIDYRTEKFTDILIKNIAEVKQTLRANRALLVGAILRTLTVSPSGPDNTSFSFLTTRSGIPDKRILGKESVAIETLKRDESLLRQIEAEILKRRSKLPAHARWKFYTVLAYHTMRENKEMGYKQGPFAPDMFETDKGAIETYSPEWQALNEIIEQEYQSLLTSSNEDAVRNLFSEQYQLLNNFSQEVVVNGRSLRLLNDGFDS